VKYLIDQVNRSCRHRHIQSDHVFFGGEDVNSYAENFANTIRANGWLVANVNAHDAKKAAREPSGQHGSAGSDGHCHHAAQPPGQLLPGTDRRVSQPANPGAPSKKLVKMKTEVRNRIHTIVDRLFPGFLNEKKSGILPFSNSSLYLMQERFSAPQIRRRQRSALIRNLEKRGTKKAEQVAAKLQEYASQVLRLQTNIPPRFRSPWPAT
jgi:hypothetical protein